MSKSLGNFFTVRDLLDQGIPGEVVRLVMLGTHYGKPMDWTDKKRSEADQTLRNWRGLVDGVEAGAVDQELIDTLADDLNTAGAIARLYVLAKGDAAIFKASAEFMGFLTDALGDWAKVDDVDLSALADKLAALRTAAMETKDFSAVDAMKKALMEAGVEVRMSKAGVELLPAAGFDAAKLEGL